MIHFAETRDTIKLQVEDDIRYEAGALDNKKDDFDIWKKEGKFWENQFAALSKREKLDEESIGREVFGCSAEDFTFDFDVKDSDISQILKPFEEASWEKQDISEKKKYVSALAEILGKKLDIKNMPEIQFYEADLNDCGAYEAEENTISINQNLLFDAKEIVNTVSHEMRHAYQYQCANNPKTHLDELYAYNFEHYIDAYDDFSAYEDQLLEAEARAFAALFDQEDDECLRR